MNSPFCGERPQTNEQRLAEFYRRWHAVVDTRLMDDIEELADLIGMGDLSRIPSCLRRQAS